MKGLTEMIFPFFLFREWMSNRMHLVDRGYSHLFIWLAVTTMLPWNQKIKRKWHPPQCSVYLILIKCCSRLQNFQVHSRCSSSLTRTITYLKSSMSTYMMFLSKHFGERISRLVKVCQCLLSVGLQLYSSEYIFCVDQLEMLWHAISPTGINGNWRQCEIFAMCTGAVKL